jgi:hypothetical protein
LFQLQASVAVTAGRKSPARTAQQLAKESCGILGGAAVDRCDKHPVLNLALQSAEKLGFVSGIALAMP